MQVFTIGFTQKSAEDFFQRIRGAGVRRLVDVRLNNSSQLAAFAKRDDLRYFLKQLCGAEYQHEPLLAPTQAMLDTYKKQRGGWKEYEHSFLDLMRERQIEKQLPQTIFREPTVLLCSEATAENCHRRLVLEYLNDKWKGLEAIHL